MQTIGSHVWLHDEGPTQTLRGWRRRAGYMSVGELGSGGGGVPDPCLSGAAMFTVRKEAVNCVCSHLSKTEQLLAHPPTLGDRERAVHSTFIRAANEKRGYFFP